MLTLSFLSNIEDNQSTENKFPWCDLAYYSECNDRNNDHVVEPVHDFFLPYL